MVDLTYVATFSGYGCYILTVNNRQELSILNVPSLIVSKASDMREFSGGRHSRVLQILQLNPGAQLINRRMLLYSHTDSNIVYSMLLTDGNPSF